MHKQQGSIFFYILIAVALLAAVTVAVTASMRVSSGNMNVASEEKAKIAATELVDWVQQANNETQQIFLKGYSEDHLSFHQKNMGWIQPCDVTEGGCHLYKWEARTDGGLKQLALSAKEYARPEWWATYADPATNAGLPYIINIKDLGTASKGEIVFLTSGLTEAVCREINKMVGLQDTYPLDHFSLVRYEFMPGVQIPEPTAAGNSQIGDEVAELAGKKTFCVRDGSFSGDFAFLVQVLKVR